MSCRTSMERSPQFLTTWRHLMVIKFDKSTGVQTAEQREVKMSTACSPCLSRSRAREGVLTFQTLRNVDTDERLEGNDSKSSTSYRGMISSCFEPHMNAYVDLEEREMISSLNEIMTQEPWDGSDSSSSQVLGSSEKVFLLIKKSLKRCSALTKGQTLVNLSRVWQTIINMRE